MLLILWPITIKLIKFDPKLWDFMNDFIAFLNIHTYIIKLIKL